MLQQMALCMLVRASSLVHPVWDTPVHKKRCVYQAPAGACSIADDAKLQHQHITDQESYGLSIVLKDSECVFLHNNGQVER
jgi:hypothetical protein